MHIPPASFRATPYGDVDAKALDSLRATYDTSQLLSLVDRLDACLATIGGVGSIRDNLLRLHAMTFDAQPGEPAIRQLQMSLFAQSTFGANAVAVAHDQQANHKFRINRWTPERAIKIGETMA